MANLKVNQFLFKEFKHTTFKRLGKRKYFNIIIHSNSLDIEIKAPIF